MPNTQSGRHYLLHSDILQIEPMLTPATFNGDSITGTNRFPFSNFKYFSLSFQSSFHLSLTVLVRYRSLADI